MKKFSISISRQFGSLGRPIAKRLSEILGVEYYDRDIVDMVAKKHNISVKEISELEEHATPYSFMKFPLGTGSTAAQDRIFKAEAAIIREIAAKESCIIVGRCSDSILEDYENHLNVFIYAPYENRLVNCVNELGMNTKQAKKMISDTDSARDAYHMRYVKYLPNDPNHIDLMINSALFGVEGTAKLLAYIVKQEFGDDSNE
ncbi:MAG: AAA family ATPase [Lachnospiraceae bacterium]